MKVVVIGAGGHAKVVIATLQAVGHQVEAAYDDDRGKWGRNLLGVPIKGPIDALLLDGELAATLALGDNRVRREVGLRLAGLGVRFVTAIHPTAFVHSSVTLGAGSVVFANSTIQPDTVIGMHVIINTAASVDHDCVLGDHVHLAPGVHLAGGVALEEGVFMGIGSAAIPGSRVGAWATVGAGGVVIQSIPANVVAVGLPARARDRRK